MIRNYVRANGVRLLAALILGFMLCVGIVDPSTAFAGGILLEAGGDLKALEAAMKTAYAAMEANLKKAQDTAVNALEEVKKLGGTIEAKTQDKLKEIDENRVKVQGEVVALRAQVLELAQKAAATPQGGSGDEQKSLYEVIVSSDQWKQAKEDPSAKEMRRVIVGNFHRRWGVQATQITNPNPLSNDNPLVPAQRVAGIIVPPEQRLYIRDLLPQARASSNLIEFASEATFTNNARPQGDASPVGGGEGEEKAESGMTFSLSNAPVITIAHHIPASRQILNDAMMLQGHISGRLLYGLKLEEEQELLTGVGAAGEMNGINNQASAFTGGVTNATILDTLLRALLQVSLSNFEASAFVLHPVDWFSAMLLKDTQGRYLFTNPQDMVAPRVWAKTVVASQTQPVGRFTAGAFNLGAQIWDMEDANVRISENVGRQFVQNMVTLLCEERLALTVYRPTAFVYGSTSYAG